MIKFNDQMTERLKFKVDLQEQLFRRENGEIMNKDGKDAEVKEKRMGKQEIKNYIKEKILKAKRELDSDVKEIHE